MMSSVMFAESSRFSWIVFDSPECESTTYIRFECVHPWDITLGSLCWEFQMRPMLLQNPAPLFATIGKSIFRFPLTRFALAWLPTGIMAAGSCSPTLNSIVRVRNGGWLYWSL